MDTDEQKLKDVEGKLQVLYGEKQGLENAIAARKAQAVIALFNDKETLFKIHNNTIYLYGNDALDDAIRKLGDGWNHFEAPISDNIALVVNDERAEVKQINGYSTNPNDYIINTVITLKKLGVHSSKLSFIDWDDETRRAVKHADENREEFYALRDSIHALYN